MRWAQRMSHDSRLSARARAVAHALACHAPNSDTPVVKASINQIGEWTAMSRPTVIAAIKDLCDNDWIVKLRSRQGNRQSRNEYCLICPEPEAPPPPPLPEQQPTHHHRPRRIDFAGMAKRI